MALQRVSNKKLHILLEGLQQHKDAGIKDPWVLSDGTKIEPLDVLKDLYDERQKNK